MIALNAALCLYILDIPTDILRTIYTVIADIIRPKYVHMYDRIIGALNNYDKVIIRKPLPLQLIAFTDYYGQNIDHCDLSRYTIDNGHNGYNGGASLCLYHINAHSHEEFRIIKFDEIIKRIALLNYDLFINKRYQLIILDIVQY